MKKRMIRQLDAEVVKFLAQHHYLPAIKEREKEIEKFEKKLIKKLFRMQIGLESAFINELRKRGYIGGSVDQTNLIETILNTPFEEMMTVISNEGVKVAELSRQLTIQEVMQQGIQATVSAFSERVKNKLKEKIYTFSQDTFQRIKGDFKTTLSQAYQEGVGIDETARRLREDFKNLRDHRLRTIARTEIQSAQNEGTNETMRELGVRYKQWLTVGDSNVRGNHPRDEYDHISLHGEVVQYDEPFSNGLMFPGDRTGDIGDWINCRCRMRPYIPRKDENILTTPYYP